MKSVEKISEPHFLDLMRNYKMSQIRLLSGESNPELAKLISKQLGVPLTSIKKTVFANTEMNIEIQETVRGCDCYIIQTGGAYQGRSVNDHLMELYLLVDACRLSSARSVQVIIPCYPYARSDKKDAPRVSIAGALISRNLADLGVDRIIALDLHSGQIQGFSQIPFDNFYCMNLHIENLKNTVFKNLTKEQINEKFILVSPDVGAVKLILKYAAKLEMSHVIMNKQRNYSKPNEILKTDLIGGDIKGKITIIIDDIIDTASTVIAAVGELIKFGASGVIIIASHGILSGPAIERINSCDAIIKVIVTNTLPQEENIMKCGKFQVVDVSNPLAKMIERLQLNDGSVSKLFD